MKGDFQTEKTTNGNRFTDNREICNADMDKAEMPAQSLGEMVTDHKTPKIKMCDWKMDKTSMLKLYLGGMHD